MGSDDFFKHRKGNKKKRKEESKKLAPYRYLIVCEGTKTEPYYFQGIKRLIDQKYEDTVTIKERKFNINIVGTGRNTEDLVNFTIEEIDKAKSLGELPYGNIWVVFDKDDFTEHQFNNAITQAKRNDYKVAWSNEAIELWFLLYFEYLQSSVHRSQYIDKLNEYFCIFGLGKYEKNLKNIYEILNEFGNLDNAIANAKRLRKLYVQRQILKPAQMNPCTTVDILVEELLNIIR